MKKIFIVIILLLIFTIQAANSNSDSIRIELLDTITKQLDVRETSYNRGKMVDIYNNEVGTVLGSSWCGSFVGSNLAWVGVPTPPNPHSAWSPNYATNIIWKAKRNNNITPKSGDVVTFYYSNLGRIGHTGFYIKTDNDGYFITIEGNTNNGGSREGDGVYKKKRDPNKVYAISRYIE